MKNSLDLIIRLAEAEYRGPSMNGSSLMETLRPLSASTAANRETYEGFSPWDNLVHCIYFKYFLARHLGVSSILEPYPWEEGSFPPLLDISEKAWKEALDYSDLVHDTLIKALHDLDPGRLEERVEKWDRSLGEAISWIPAHDSYHVGQIRSMGLEELRKPFRPKWLENIQS